MISIPSVLEIRDQLVNEYEANLGQTVSPVPRSFIRVYSLAVAGVLYLVYNFGLWVYRQIFAQFADIEQLRVIGSDYNIIQTPAVKARLDVQATGTNGTDVPAGTLYSFEDTVYRVVNLETVASGVVDLLLECLVEGDIGNLPNSSIVTIVTQIVGLSTTATVTSTDTIGADAEATESYRDRILIRRRTPPQGGSTADWVTWTREVPGVVKAVAWRTAPGEVTVYPLVGFTQGDRLPDAGELAAITAYISDPIRRPLNCENAEAALFTEKAFDITFSNLSPDTAELRATIIAAAEDYLIERFPRQYLAEVNPVDIISVMDLYALSKEAGATAIQIQLDETVGPSDIQAYQLGNSQLAIPGTVDFA